MTWGYGITNLVERATATATELAADELIRGRRQLEGKVQLYQPRVVAVLGVGAYRTAFKQPKAILGRQYETVGGAALWLLPNPSGLNAHYQLKELAQHFAALRVAVEG